MNKTKFIRKEEVDMSAIIDSLDTNYFTSEHLHGCGLTLASNDMLVSTYPQMNIPLMYKEIISLVQENKISEAIRRIKSLKEARLPEIEVLYQYLMCLFDPRRYQFYQPYPFAAGMTLLHYTQTTVVNIVSGQVFTFTYKINEPDHVTLYLGAPGSRLSSSYASVPEQIHDIIADSKYVVVSHCMSISPNASAINVSGRVFGGIHSGDDDTGINALSNALVSYQGHLKDGVHVNTLPMVDAYSSDAPKTTISVVAPSQEVTFYQKIVVMVRIKQPYSTFAQKIRTGNDSIAFKFPRSEVIDIAPDLFVNSVSYFDSSKRSKRAEEVALLLCK